MAKQLKDLIRQAREEAGFTREQMAPKVGVTMSTLYRYETGENEPTVKRMTEIAKVTGKPLAFFFAEVG